MGFLKIDQIGLPAGTVGVARTDGLDNGALVTLTNTNPNASTTTIKLLWVPLDATTAAASLAPTGTPTIWTFAPDANKWGTYLIELVSDAGMPTKTVERRIFGVRTPVAGLRIPALNELADPIASLVNVTQGRIDASDDNAGDYSTPELNNLRFGGWWRALQELFTAVENGGGGGGGGVTTAKGSNGITPNTPQVGPVTLSGAALYARDGSNGAMVADVNFGGVNLLAGGDGAFTGTFSVNGQATLLGLITGPLGLAMVPQAAAPFTGSPTRSGVWSRTDGKLVFTDTANADHVLSYATPGAPSNSVQYNGPGGGFTGSAGNLYSEPAAGSSAYESQITGLFSQVVKHTPTATEVFRVDAGGAPVITMRLPGVSTSATTLTHSGGLTTLQRAGAGSHQVKVHGQDGLELSAGASNLLSMTNASGTLFWPTVAPSTGQVLSYDGTATLAFTNLPPAASLQSAYQVGRLIDVNDTFLAVKMQQGGPFTGAQPTLEVSNTSATQPALKVTAVGAGLYGVYAQAQGTAGQSAILAEATASGGEGLRVRHLVSNGGIVFVAESNGFEVIKARNGVVTLGQAALAIPNVDGTAGQYVTTNGAGQLGFTTLPAAPTLYNQRIQSEGANLTQRPTFNFIGSGATAVDNGGSNRTDITIRGVTATVINAASTQTPTSTQLEQENRCYAFDTSGGARSLVLPSVVAAGTTLKVKDKYQGGAQASTNNITITAAGGETIDGQATYIIGTDMGSIQLIKGLAADWMVV